MPTRELRSELERHLDADIARVLGDEEPEAPDHNADKKVRVAPIATHDEDGAEEPGGDTAVMQTVVTPTSDEQNFSADLTPVTSEFPEILPKSDQRQEKSPPKDVLIQEEPDQLTPSLTSSRESSTDSTTSKIFLAFSDIDLIEMSYLQSGALKALTVLMTSSHYLELLLVPRFVGSQLSSNTRRRTKVGLFETLSVKLVILHFPLFLSVCKPRSLPVYRK